MKKYIELNEHTQIRDVFFEYQRNKMQSTTKIYIGDTAVKHKINNKSISNKYGTYIFTYDSTGGVSQRTVTQINNDTDFIAWYKKDLKNNLDGFIKDNLGIEITKSLEQIKTQYNNFLQSCSSMTTKTQLDNAFNTAMNWLTST